MILRPTKHLSVTPAHRNLPPPESCPRHLNTDKSSACNDNDPSSQATAATAFSDTAASWIRPPPPHTVTTKPSPARRHPWDPPVRRVNSSHGVGRRGEGGERAGAVRPDTVKGGRTTPIVICRGGHDDFSPAKCVREPEWGLLNGAVGVWILRRSVSSWASDALPDQQRTKPSEQLNWHWIAMKQMSSFK